MFLNDAMKSDRLYWKGDVVLSNENKKAWISLVVPAMYVVVVLYFLKGLDNFMLAMMIFPFFLIIQFFLSKYLNKRFPSSGDLKDLYAGALSMPPRLYIFSIRIRTCLPFSYTIWLFIFDILV